MELHYDKLVRTTFQERGRWCNGHSNCAKRLKKKLTETRYVALTTRGVTGNIYFVCWSTPPTITGCHPSCIMTGGYLIVVIVRNIYCSMPESTQNLSN